MKILVTGSNGLVGNAIRHESTIYKNEHEFIFTTRENANLCSYQETFNMIQTYRPDTVLHLAANVGGLFKNMKYKVQMFEDNININMNIIKASHENNVHTFIGILSTCIFPDNAEYPISEMALHDGAPHESNAEYAYAKRMMDIQCGAYRKQYNRNYYCMIPTNIYGPHDNFDLENGHVIPSLIHKCYLAQKNQLPFIICGTGRPLRQFIYSYDLANIILQIIILGNNTKEFEKKLSSLIISVHEKDETSIGDIATHIASIMDYPYVQYDTSLSDGQYKKTANNTKLIKTMKLLNKEIHFTPIRTGLEKTIKWFMIHHRNP